MMFWGARVSLKNKRSGLKCRTRYLRSGTALGLATPRQFHATRLIYLMEENKLMVRDSYKEHDHRNGIKQSKCSGEA